jgi:hypothetical protein
VKAEAGMENVSEGIMNYSKKQIRAAKLAVSFVKSYTVPVPGKAGLSGQIIFLNSLRLDVRKPEEIGMSRWSSDDLLFDICTSERYKG